MAVKRLAQTGSPARTRPVASEVLLREIAVLRGQLAKPKLQVRRAAEKGIDAHVRRLARLGHGPTAQRVVLDLLAGIDTELQSFKLTPAEADDLLVDGPAQMLRPRRIRALWDQQDCFMRLAAAIGLGRDPVEPSIARWLHHRRRFGDRDLLRRLRDARGPLGWERGARAPLPIKQDPLEVDILRLRDEGLSRRAAYRTLAGRGRLTTRWRGEARTMVWEQFRRRFGHLWPAPLRRSDRPLK